MIPIKNKNFFPETFPAKKRSLHCRQGVGVKKNFFDSDHVPFPPLIVLLFRFLQFFYVSIVWTFLKY